MKLVHHLQAEPRRCSENRCRCAPHKNSKNMQRPSSFIDAVNTPSWFNDYAVHPQQRQQNKSAAQPSVRAASHEDAGASPIRPSLNAIADASNASPSAGAGESPTRLVKHDDETPSASPSRQPNISDGSPVVDALTARLKELEEQLQEATRLGYVPSTSTAHGACIYNAQSLIYVHSGCI